MKALLPAVFLLALSACAGLSANALPEAGTALNGVAAFYGQVCTDPLPVNANACEQVKPRLNEIIEFYNEVNESFGESE